MTGRYPAEIHVVHYNKKYPDFSEASHHADGLAVLGIMVEVGHIFSISDSILTLGFIYIISWGQRTTLIGRRCWTCLDTSSKTALKWR